MTIQSTPIKIDLRCPHCKLEMIVPIFYEHLGGPFTHKCDKRGSGCGKYFAVKVALTFEAECCKIFEGEDSEKLGPSPGPMGGIER